MLFGECFVPINSFNVNKMTVQDFRNSSQLEINSQEQKAIAFLTQPIEHLELYPSKATFGIQETLRIMWNVLAMRA